MGFFKFCPECGEKQVYKGHKGHLNSAVEANSRCKKCNMTFRFRENTKKWNDLGLTKLCPDCVEKQTYTCLVSFKRAVRDNIKCPSCRSKGKIPGNKGTGHYVKVCGYQGCISETVFKYAYLKKRAEAENWLCRRCSQIKKLDEGGRLNCLKANPVATEFFTLFNAVMGWDGQYKGYNGGEKLIVIPQDGKRSLTYSLDYYYLDPIIGNHICGEFDESSHLRQSHLKKDILRQKAIEEHLGPNCLFLRFNEKSGDWHEII
jgi:hypothetical protein